MHLTECCAADERFTWLLDPGSIDSAYLSSAFVIGPAIGMAVLAVGGYFYQSMRSNKAERYTKHLEDSLGQPLD